MADKIGVGIIGANPDRGWALRAHIPALRSLPQYEIRALSTSQRDSALAASQKFGVAQAFDNHHDLVRRGDVDVVAVTVKVPHHHELVMAAFEAGKIVYCEWPLGNGLAEAEQMARLAARKGLRTVVGLQARASPVINYVRDLIAGGYVGKVLSTSVVASGGAYGEFVEPPSTYLLDKTNGANLLTIPAGHFLDAMCWCLGEFEELSARLAIRRPQVKVTGTNEVLTATSPDQVAVTGVLQGGAVASVHFRIGIARGTKLLWEINGTDGDLTITGPSGHVQWVELGLQGARGQDPMAPLPIPAQYRWAPAATPSGAPLNVAQAYLRLAADIQNKTDTAPSFAAGVARHRMIEAIEAAASTGVRRTGLA